MKYLIGIDIGTSGTKTVLFDAQMRVVCDAAYSYPLYQEKNGWAEQNPQDWADATLKGLKSVLTQSNINNNDIAGIGLSGQMHGLVMLDKDKKVLRKSIIWCDQRTSKESKEITDKVGKEKLIAITANPAMTSFTLAKLLWVKNNEMEIYAKCKYVLLPKDYVRFILTDALATEVSDAGGMQLMDIKNRCWSAEILKIFDINEQMLPTLYESCEISGHINKKTAAISGLKEGTAVVGGAGDQAASAIGNGIIREGIVSQTLGSSGVIFACTDKPLIDPMGRVHTLCHAIPNMWHIMSVTQGCGLSLKWFKDNFCAEEMEKALKTDSDVYDILFEKAKKLPIGSDNLIFLPYLMGERSPHMDENARGVFFGLSNIHTKSHLFKSVVEGVTFSQRECFEIITSLGITPSAVRVGGGGSKSKVWLQMLADNMNIKAETLNTKETGAMGVAILAGVGTGIYTSVKEACDNYIETKNSVLPQKDIKEKYNNYFKTYSRLYKNLKELFASQEETLIN